MNESRKKILAMLSEGRISVDEAAQLLEKVSSTEEPEKVPAPQGSVKNPRFLRVVIDSNDGSKVNVRVPLSLIKTGIKLGSLMPKEAAQTVSDKGFDLSSLSQLDENELAQALGELEVAVDGSDGETVRIFAE
jgi:predicted HTH domain antitoxin